MLIKPTNDISSDKWQDLTIEELVDQKSLLSKRYFAMVAIGKYQIAENIKMGLDQLDSIIMYKTLEK